MFYSFSKVFCVFIWIFLLEADCCDQGWQQYKSKCFKYIQTKVNFKNGVQLCSHYNATLASVHSREELLFIEDIARRYSTASGVHWVWLGGQRIENNKTDGFIVDPKNNNTFERSKPEFAWQDGSPFDYSEWRFSCPDTKRDEKCILMSIFQSRPSHWCNYKCESNQDHVICQKIMSVEEADRSTNETNEERNQTEIGGSAESGSCEVGWTLNDNFCYKFFETNQTWSVAYAMCVKNNANLLSIHSEAEQMFVQNYLFTINGALEAVWLGAKRKFKEFRWVDNTTFNYQNYAPHEPDFRNQREDCLAMNNVDEYFGLWLDAPCNVMFSVACRKRAKRAACSNVDLIGETQKAMQMNDLIVQLLQQITNRLDERSPTRKAASKDDDQQQINKAIAMEIKSEVDSILNNSSLIKLSLHLSIFISMILICFIMCVALVLFKRRSLLKRPYTSIFSFKNLNYEDKNLNGNEYEELLYGQNANASISPSSNARHLSDKV